jgi:DNA-binding GntR family transcriptional regulator
MLEAGMTREFVQSATSSHIKALKLHIAQEKAAIHQGDIAVRTSLLGDFHVRMAQLMGNEVLASMLSDLISRCALITLMYQSPSDAVHSHEEHKVIVDAIQTRNEALALQLMDAHLRHVEQGLTLHELTATA